MTAPRRLWLCALLTFVCISVPPNAMAADTPVAPAVGILVDDFRAQPNQGDSQWFYNSVDGDRGALNDSQLAFGKGFVKVTVASGRFWGGLWESPNHPIREHQAIDFSAILPGQVKPAFQSSIASISVDVATGSPGRVLDPVSSIVYGTQRSLRPFSRRGAMALAGSQARDLSGVRSWRALVSPERRLRGSRTPRHGAHYAAMLAAFSPVDALRMWRWLIERELFSPLNNVESLSFETDSSCGPDDVVWNDAKNSWNLALQSLGMGQYLVQREASDPSSGTSHGCRLFREATTCSPAY
jgi:hypothetical protein